MATSAPPPAPNSPPTPEPLPPSSEVLPPAPLPVVARLTAAALALALLAVVVGLVAGENGPGPSGTARLILVTPCAGAPDADGDGRPDPCDCAPQDTQAFAVPSPIGDLHWRDAATLAFSSQALSAGPGTRYDVMAGDLDEVPLFGTRNGDVCVAAGSAVTQVSDTTSVPAAGHGTFFLARAVNTCGASRWESSSTGRDRPTGACP